MLREKVKEYVINLDDGDLVELWNLYCNEVNCFDDVVYFMDELDDYLYGMKPLDILNRVDKDFNTRCDYFRDGIYGIESFDYVGDVMYLDTLIDYIVENHFSGDDDELKKLLGDDDEIDAP